MSSDYQADGSVFVIEDLDAFLDSLEPQDQHNFSEGDHVVSYSSPQGFAHFYRLDEDDDGGAHIQLTTLATQSARLLADSDVPDGVRHVYDLPEEAVEAYKADVGSYAPPFEFD